MSQLPPEHSLRRAVMVGRCRFSAARAIVLIVVVLAAPLIASVFGGSFGVYALTLGTVYSFAVLGSNVVGGFLEEPNLAMGGYLALGAYAAAKLMADHLPYAMILLAAAVIAGLGAVLVAAVTLRLRDIQTALVTFALAWALPDLLNAASSLTGGTEGLSVVDVPTLGVQFASGSLYLCYLAAVLFVLAGLTVQRMLDRRPGRLLIAVAQAEQSAASFGVRTWAVRVGAGFCAGALAGVAGALYAPAVGYLSSRQFDFKFSLLIVVGTIVGGRRSVVGAWIGGTVIGTLPQALSAGVGSSELIVFGAALVAVVVGFRSGICTELEFWTIKGLRRHRRQGMRS